jgi:hypothetical protein
VTHALAGGHIRPLLDVRTRESLPFPPVSRCSGAGPARSPYVRDVPAPGLPAPGDVSAGFVVTASAFGDSMSAAGVTHTLGALWFAATLADADDDRRRLCGRITDLVRAAGPSDAVVSAVGCAYPGLDIDDFGPMTVDVLPATAVEGGDGDGERAPCVRGLPAVLHRIVECWAARFTPDAVAAWAGAEPPQPEVLVRPAARAYGFPES